PPRAGPTPGVRPGGFERPRLRRPPPAPATRIDRTGWGGPAGPGKRPGRPLPGLPATPPPPRRWRPDGPRAGRPEGPRRPRTRGWLRAARPAATSIGPSHRRGCARAERAG